VSHLSEQGSAKRRAVALTGLGLAYPYRTQGSRQRNLQKAIRALKESLRYYTRATDAYMWASIEALLGRIYSEMAKWKGPAAARTAVKCYKHAMEVLTKSDYPEDWQELHELLTAVNAKGADQNGPHGNGRCGGQ
jgi:hypothetical protein